MKLLNLSELSYAVFDLETTGLYAHEGDEIIEIGALVVENGTIQEKTYQTFVNPQKPIPAAASQVSGIKDSDVAKAPTIDKVIDSFLEFMGSRIWVAQNAKFDMSFVSKKLIDLQRPPRQNVVLDTMGMSKILFPYETSHNLDVIMARLGIAKTGERHRSLDDSRYTALALIEFIKLLEKQGVKHLTEIESAFIKTDHLMKSAKPKTKSLF